LKCASVVIPNWNGKELLAPCLRSLYAQDFGDFETILVDNGSHDGSIEFVRDHFPRVKIIGFKENRGFCAAVNAGILAADGRYIALLNNDTEVDRSWLKELVAALESDPQLGSVASKVLFHFDPQTVNSAGDEFSVFGVPYQRRWMSGDCDDFNEPRYVFSACGAAALYRRELFEKIGFFDEIFFAYQEDVDLGFRSQLAGYKCLYVPTAVVYHKYHQTSSRVADFCMHLRERNKYFVLLKNLPLKFFLLCAPLFLFHEVFALLQAVRLRRIQIYFTARWDVWRHLPLLLESRRQIQNQRLVRDAYLFGIMSFREPMWILFYRPLYAFLSRFRTLIWSEISTKGSNHART
jgi:GT2 family glycosyltransferase